MRVRIRFFINRQRLTFDLRVSFSALSSATCSRTALFSRRLFSMVACRSASRFSCCAVTAAFSFSLDLLARSSVCDREQRRLRARQMLLLQTTLKSVGIGALQVPKVANRCDKIRTCSRKFLLTLSEEVTEVGCLKQILLFRLPRNCLGSCMPLKCARSHVPVVSR